MHYDDDEGAISPTSLEHDPLPVRSVVFSEPQRPGGSWQQLPVLPLTRTLSRRSSYASESERAQYRASRSASRVAEPSAVLPVHYRTLSIDVSEAQSTAKRGDDADTTMLAELDWHRISADEALRRLGTSSARGLEGTQVARRLKSDGRNVHTPPPTNRFRKWFFFVFGGFGGILFIAGVVTVLTYLPLGAPNPQGANLALAVLLFLVIILQAVFNAWQDWTTSRVMKSITSMMPADSFVLRDGAQLHIDPQELVPGDIVYLKLGNKVPADIRISAATGDLKFDRSVLTGESEAVAATVDATSDNFLESKNLAMQGTYVTSGSGEGVVILTGDRTVFGRIAKLSSAPTGKTPLQREVMRFVWTIIGIATFFAVLVIIIWAAYLRRAFPDYIPYQGLLITVISVFVATIPEGLPVSVTLSLTIIARAMRKANIMAKTLTTVETLGSVNVVCSDKTGTLTMNKMFVSEVSIFDKTRTVDGAKECYLRGIDGYSSLHQLRCVAGLCNAATFDVTSLDLPLAERRINGDATDSAILRFSEFLGSVQQLKEEWNKVMEMPFNSKDKRMVVLMKPRELNYAAKALSPSEYEHFESGDHVMFVKGGVDVLLPKCSHVLDDVNQKMLPLDAANEKRVISVQESWADRGMRVLVLTRRTVKRSELPQDCSVNDTRFITAVQELAETGLVIVGMVAIVDPPRPEIPQVVQICRRAGMRFFMVTGDFAMTATAIARQCGIITTPNVHTVADLQEDVSDEKPGSASIRLLKAIVITGDDIRNLNDVQWGQICQYDEIVAARTQPEQKLKIVKELQKRGGTVAVTGDGVNDAPSLKAADIGVAMGGGRYEFIFFNVVNR